MPARRGHLRDAGAHLAGADDHDPLDHGPSTSITIASPWPPPEQIAASPRPPPAPAQLVHERADEARAGRARRDGRARPRRR